MHTVKKMDCFNHRVVILVAWLILVSEANIIKQAWEVVSLLFPPLPYFRMRKEELENNKETALYNQPIALVPK